MKMRRKWVLWSVVTLVGVALVIAFMWLSEPEYGGKRLSEWVNEYVEGSNAAECDHAIRQIGTQALPYLMAWFKYETPPWARKFLGAVNPLITWSGWQLNDDPDVYRAYKAKQGLIALGQQAAPAIPTLDGLLNDKHERATVQRTIDVLVSLGSAGTPTMMKAFTNAHASAHRAYIVFRAAELGTNARPAVPVLVAFLKDPDLNLRPSAAHALCGIDPSVLITNGLPLSYCIDR